MTSTPPIVVVAPLQGSVVALPANVGDTISGGSVLVVIESMKMEHIVAAPSPGTVMEVLVGVGDQVTQGDELMLLDPTSHASPAEAGFAAGSAEATPAPPDVDLGHIRPDLAEVLARHHLGLDEGRGAAVAKRHGSGHRTARENIEDLVDAGTLVEYAPLVIAAQRGRRELQDLIERTPADGLVAGIGHINGHLYEPQRSRCAVLSYDYTVLAGTQGVQNHRKKDRLFEIAEKLKLPVVFFTEGGGGRPGDSDALGVSGLDCLAFAYWGRLAAQVPLVGISSGFCFAGNAAILGMCDVVIATASSNIAMAGPAMIEGGGLGRHEPTALGPVQVQAANGTVDIVVTNEEEAVAVAKKYLGYFQGAVAEWSCGDQRTLRHVVPENRKRTYSISEAILGLADDDSVLELGAAWGTGMLTCFARIEGRPIGIIANNNEHLSGAIDVSAADKAAEFMELCDSYEIPILFLCDTPGFMVGPDSEAEGMVRHAGRLFRAAAKLEVPFFTIVTRKAYGLGAQAMAGGGFKMGLFTVSWPTGEFGGMGLEGFVKLGFRRELEAAESDEARQELYDNLLAKMYEQGKALSVASHFEIDDVIDPADSRRWITGALSCQ